MSDDEWDYDKWLDFAGEIAKSTAKSTANSAVQGVVGTVNEKVEWVKSIGAFTKRMHIPNKYQQLVDNFVANVQSIVQNIMASAPEIFGIPSVEAAPATSTAATSSSPSDPAAAQAAVQAAGITANASNGKDVTDPDAPIAPPGSQSQRSPS